MSKVATIGFFDGVHLGHNYLLEQLKTEAQQRGMQSVVVTFANHPRLFFDPNCALKQLTLSDEKVDLLKQKGVDEVVMLQFDDKLSKLTSREFMQLLVENYGVKVLLMGYDHRFGSDRSTSFDEYIAYGKQLGLEIKRCDGFSESEVMVSSSKVRRALELWDIPLANKFLGYKYFVKGRVVEGQKIGRQIGFPTANLQVDSFKLIPSDGVYVVEVVVRGKEYRGVLNIGTRPTVSGDKRTIEVHIIGYEGVELYGEELELRFLRFLRHEQRFSSLENLREQIRKDFNRANV
ncbi:MAG: bifunctional riboflavin kinase/FAD synthetase [Paludibacteraceae bacterium]|nr:bifunctional riboflavin kinase/FAD synthetase [Paludibacteraceae bacterium]